jgi:MFS family permease
MTAAESAVVKPLSASTVMSLAPLFAALFLDAADATYFQGVFRALEVDLGLTLINLSYLQGVGAMAVMIFGPMWALAADQRILSRKMLLAVSCTGWGCVSISIGRFVTTFWQLLALRFVNAAFLSSGIPITQYFICTLVPAEQRGRCFGFASIAGALGVIVCSQLSTTFSEEIIFGFAGWRCGLFCLGSMSLIFAALIFTFMEEPSVDEAEDSKSAGSFHASTAFRNLGEHWKVLSFRVLCIQGCFGLFAYQVMSFSTMWFQYCGLADPQAGFITACWHSGCLVGALFGGLLSDFLYKTSPLHGRQYMAQVGLSCAVPIVVIVFYILPRGPGSMHFLCPFMALFGVSTGMIVPGVIRPLMSQIAPRSQVASMIAWEFSLEQFFGSLWGPLLVTWLSSISGYTPMDVSIAEMPASLRESNMEALAFVIRISAIFGYSCCIVGFTALHFTFKYDMKVIEYQKADEELLDEVITEKSKLLGKNREV